MTQASFWCDLYSSSFESHIVWLTPVFNTHCRNMFAEEHRQALKLDWELLPAWRWTRTIDCLSPVHKQAMFRLIGLSWSDDTWASSSKAQYAVCRICRLKYLLISLGIRIINRHKLALKLLLMLSQHTRTTDSIAICCYIIAYEE